MCNQEVLDVVSQVYEKAKGRKDNTRSQEILRTITYETRQYLADTPCKDQTDDHIREFLKQTRTANLTK